MPQSRWHDPGPRSRYHDDAESYPSSRGQTRRPPPSARRTPRRWGALPGQAGVWLIAGGAALGLLATVAAGGQPGNLLGAFIVAGTLAASLAVRSQAVYLLIPVPALAYPVAAAAAGLANGQADGKSHAALAVGAAQWVASGFLAMTAATVLAIAVTVARRRRRDQHGPPRFRQPPPAARRGSRHGGPRGQRTGRRLPRDAGYPLSGFAGAAE